MLQLDQMKTEIQQYESTMHEVLDSLDLEYKKQRIEELQRESEAPDFWSDADTANKKMKQLKDLQTTVEDAEHVESQYEDILMLIEMGNEENDESVIEPVREDLDAFKNKLEEMRLATSSFPTWNRPLSRPLAEPTFSTRRITSRSRRNFSRFSKYTGSFRLCMKYMPTTHQRIRLTVVEMAAPAAPIRKP
jgi:hypothetical protein